MNRNNDLLKTARSVGYTGSLPNGANGIKKNDDGSFSITLADGTTKKYDKSGSVFNPPAETPAKPADDGAKPAAADNNKKVDNNSGDGKGKTNAGSGSGSGSLFGNGFASNDYSGFGMNMDSLNAGFTIDPEKFMKSSAGLWGALNLTANIPFGLGAIFGQGAIGAAIGSFVNAVSFNVDYKKIVGAMLGERSQSAGDNPPTGGTETATDEAPADSTTASGTSTTSGTSASTVKPDEQATASASASGSAAQGGSASGEASASGAVSSRKRTSGAHGASSSNGASSTNKAGAKGKVNGATGANNAQKAKATSGKVSQNHTNAFDNLMNKMTNETSIAFAKSGITKDEVAKILNKSSNYSVVKDSNSLIVVNKANNQKRIFKFDAQGRVVSVANSNSNYGGGISASVSYGQNNKIAKTNFVESGRRAVETNFGASGQPTSINEKVWRQTASGGTWKTKSNTTYHKQSLGDAAKYMPKFEPTTQGYSKTGNYAKVTTNKGTWSQTQSKNQYTFRSSDNLKKYWVDSRNGKILQEAEYDKEGNLVRQRTLTKTVTNYDV